MAENDRCTFGGDPHGGNCHRRAGAPIWLAGIPLAWPDPALMLAVSLIGGLLFTAVGLRYAIPPAHVLAAASLSLAGLLATHVLRGAIGWQESDPGLVARVLASASSGEP